jgi:hypothetical protein
VPSATIEANLRAFQPRAWGPWTIVGSLGRDYDRPVRAYALVEVDDREAIDVFLRREDALAALEGCLRDEPDWEGFLCVVPIELDERDVSAN